MSNDFKLMLIQIFIIIVLIVVIIYLIRQNVAIKFERRIGRYSIEPLKNEDVSVLDGINKKIIEVFQVENVVTKEMAI